MQNRSLGQIAYEAYCDDTDTTPEWEEQPMGVKSHWEASGEAVARKVLTKINEALAEYS